MTVRTRWLCLAFLCLAGCNSTPEGYEKIDAIVPPKGRAIGIVPFRPQRPGGTVTLVDGITLAELAARDLRKKLPHLKVVGPNEMRDLLRGGMNESRWYDIGRGANVDLLVVGRIKLLDTHYDKMLQLREGSIHLKFRVLDVTVFPPKLVATIDWRLHFPENDDDKFDTKYVSMDALTFRRAVLSHGARSVGTAFYDDFKRRPVASRYHATWDKEQ